MTYRLPPGPVGTSCLTCKRRHKKCDRFMPVCNRCSKGGYECLGYEHNKSESSRLGNDDESSQDTTAIHSFPSPVSSSSTHSTNSSRDDEALISHDTLAAPALYGSRNIAGYIVPQNAVNTPRPIN
ncbi:fungal Zn(2)-cys(6) binuclear cluster domain protein [Rhizoctonia solani AG-3 Rhs1AP]|uniref:Fungal Zn(2)-cys(6) binuclear cluster domain protein n=2 Tax=Rhizoctonia solani AG-3 TaxID=1086053 RepID=A0A074RQD8_9AGAM|nr:fungal Zn(2)-cys(6) binuclear cluster domain protein [Rhizoctonia solani AG-3 Rhs1AP]KEP46913.1 fungal Zn(2)-cys(6) binuclear cluster domain protein [Rhizoctonia solani 123E]